MKIHSDRYLLINLLFNDLRHKVGGKNELTEMRGKTFNGKKKHLIYPEVEEESLQQPLSKV